MNNEQRDNLDELKLAEETLRVLEGERCETDQDSRTLELGRLLKQSASHEMPESNDELREMLLAELEGEPVERAPAKDALPKSADRAGRKRVWMGLATGAMIAVGGWWVYSIGSLNVADNYQNYSNDVDLAELTAKAEAAERQVNGKSEGRDWTFNPIGQAVDPAKNFQTPGGAGEGMGGPSRGEVFYVEAEKQTELGNDSKKVPQSLAIVEDAPADFAKEKFAVSTRFSGDSWQQGEQAGESLSRGIPLPKLKTNSSDDVVSVPDRGTVLIGGVKPETGDSDQLDFAMQRPGDQQQGEGEGKGQGQGQQGQQLSRRYKSRVTAKPKKGEAVVDEAVIARYEAVNGESKSPAREDRYSEGLDAFGYYFRADQKPSDDLESKSEQLSFLESNTREQYTPIYENQFVQAAGGAAVSTFSIDVDTASYANMRRFLNSGQTPPRDSVRIEELVNYFQYDYPQPKGDDPFSVNMELASCPWNNTHKLLRVGLKGKEVHVKERPATNVVYLIDVSGSMSSNDKLPLLKRGFQMMTKQLGENDRVSIVTYAGNAGVALEPTTGDKTRTINEAIERLSPGGSTHGSAGIELAYKLAQQHFITGGVNKVILATDGDLNVGVTDDDSLVKLIKQKASEGVFLTVLGFGTGNLQDGKLEKLADNGNGHYAYLDSNREAHRVLVQQLSGSLVTIAKDVKIQIEFNPAEVKSYRLIGYENRMLATKDFDDDRKDAGEIGAGHTVTAIYEIEPTGGVAAAFVAPPGMKYQVPGAEVPQQNDDEKSPNLSDAASSGELATVALRYKKPDENKSKRIEFAIKNDDKSFTSASDDFRFAASVAGFGMILRGSEHAGTSTPAMILEMASESTGDDATGYRAEFLDLVRKACQ